MSYNPNSPANYGYPYDGAWSMPPYCNYPQDTTNTSAPLLNTQPEIYQQPHDTSPANQLPWQQQQQLPLQLQLQQQQQQLQWQQQQQQQLQQQQQEQQQQELPLELQQQEQQQQEQQQQQQQQEPRRQCRLLIVDPATNKPVDGLEGPEPPLPYNPKSRRQCRLPIVDPATNKPFDELEGPEPPLPFSSKSRRQCRLPIVDPATNKPVDGLEGPKPPLPYSPKSRRQCRLPIVDPATNKPFDVLEGPKPPLPYSPNSTRNMRRKFQLQFHKELDMAGPKEKGTSQPSATCGSPAMTSSPTSAGVPPQQPVRIAVADPVVMQPAKATSFSEGAQVLQLSPKAYTSCPVSVSSSATSKPDTAPIKEQALDKEAGMNAIAKNQESENNDQEEEIVHTFNEESIESEKSSNISSLAPSATEGGPIRYGRDFLLSLRFLKQCMELPQEMIYLDRDLVKKLKKTDSNQDSRDGFAPSYAQSKQDDSEGRYGQKQTSGRGGHAPKVIEINTKLDTVELQKAEHAWKRSSQVVSNLDEDNKLTLELHRKFQSIVNKLTPENFPKLSEQAKELAEKMDTEERIGGCIDKVFAKALDEPVFSATYARLCSVLAPHKVQVLQEDGQTKDKSFKSLLLSKCQKLFQKVKVDVKELELMEAAVEAAENEKEKKEKKAACDLAKFKARKRSLGNAKFIGELFLLNLLSESIIHQCIQQLLASTSDEDSLERFAMLMTTIGKELDRRRRNTATQNAMKKYFSRVSYIVNANTVGPRILCLLQDVQDLRKNSWVPRKVVAANMPTTIEKLHEQHQKEAQEMKSLAEAHSRQGRSTQPWRKNEKTNSSSRSQESHTAVDKRRFNRLQESSQVKQKRLGQSAWGQPRAKPTLQPTKPEPVSWTTKSQSPAVTADVRNALSEEDVERVAEKVYKDLCSNFDYKDACLSVSEMKSPGMLHKLVFSVLNTSLEKSSKARDIAGQFFTHLLQSKLLSGKALIQGLNELLEFSDDLECDIPKFWEYLEQVLAHPVSSGALERNVTELAQDKAGKYLRKLLGCRVAA